ncbi:MAG: hypothetical protein COB93_02520, partial [Sneathiella sp.]
MANQTITVDTNHDAVTARAAGEFITLNAGATLTINSEPQRTPMGILHSVRCTDGTCLIDGRDVRHLELAATASFVVGEIVTGGTSGAVGEIIRIMDATTLKLRSVTGGPFQAGEAVTGSTTGTSTASGADTVGTLEILSVFGFPAANTRQGQITGRGTWFELGVSSGAASQVLNHWTENAVDIGAVWVETGLGTGIYKPWVGLGTGQTLAGVNAKAGELGNVFQYDNTTATITFGDGVNGNIPVSGARIRVPNVLLLTGTTASSPLATDPNYTARASFQTNGSLAIDFEVVDLSGMETTFWGCYSVHLIETAFCANLTIAECGSKPTIHDCATGCHRAENTIAFNIRDTASGGDIQRGNFMSRAARAGYIETSAGTVLKDTIFNVHSPIGNANGLQIFKSPDVVVDNCVAYGNYGILATSDSTDILIKNCRAAQLPSTSTACFFLGSSGAKVENPGIPVGITALAAGAALIRGEDTPDVEIKNIGSVGSPIDCRGILYPVLFTGATSDVDVANLHVFNYGIRVVTGQAAGARIRAYNVVGDGLNDIQISSQDVEIWSYRDGDADFGLIDSIRTGLTNIYDSAYAATFQGDTEGTISLFFTEKANNPSLYEITAGTPVFNSKGAAIFDQGDQIVYTWPRKILGYTGFQNVAPELRYLNQLSGNLATEFTIEYDIDTGAGYSGSWATANGTNLSPLTVSPVDGFGFKIRVTKTGAGVGAINDSMNFLGLRMVTTITAQQELYNASETVVQITAPNLPDGTRYQFYDVTNGVELANGVATGSFGGATNYVYTGAAIQVRLRAMFKPTATTAKRYAEEFGVLTINGLIFIPVLEDWQPHNTYGADGATFDQSNGGSITWDSNNNLIRFDGSAATVNGQAVVAWAAWLMTTAIGIRTFPNLVDYTGIGPLELYRIGVQPPLEIINDSSNIIVIADAVLERTDAAGLINAGSGTIHAMPRHNTGLLVASSQANLNAINAALALLGIDITNINTVVSDNQTEIAGARTDITAVGAIVTSNAAVLGDLNTDIGNIDVKITTIQGDVSALGTLSNNILGIATDNKKLLRADINFAASLANFYEEGTTTILMTKNMAGGTGLGLP